MTWFCVLVQKWRHNILCTACSLLWPFSTNVSKSTEVFFYLLPLKNLSYHCAHSKNTAAFSIYHKERIHAHLFSFWQSHTHIIYIYTKVVICWMLVSSSADLLMPEEESEHENGKCSDDSHSKLNKPCAAKYLPSHCVPRYKSHCYCQYVII